MFVHKYGCFITFLIKCFLGRGREYRANPDLFLLLDWIFCVCSGIYETKAERLLFVRLRSFLCIFVSVCYDVMMIKIVREQRVRCVEEKDGDEREISSVNW